MTSTAAVLLHTESSMCILTAKYQVGNLQTCMMLQVAKTVNERISKYAQVTLESCAYAGTGNVLKVQQLLAQAGEHIEIKEEESWKVC